MPQKTELNLPVKENWHVAFEGTIAAGKTTLAKKFAEAFGARILLEQFDSNDFLKDFYGDRPRWVLPMQLTFLCQRYEQFSEADKSNCATVADHTFAKDALFARLLLRDRELRVYERVHEQLGRPLTKPTLIVYLDATDDILLKRIRERGRDYEMHIDESYLSELRTAYENGMIKNSDVPVIYVNTGAFMLHSVEQWTAICRRIYESIPR